MSAYPKTVTYRVRTIGRTAAIAEARDIAHAAGVRVVSSTWEVKQITPHVRDNRKELLDWDVTLAVRP